MTTSADPKIRQLKIGVENYLIKSVLGRGTFGTVFLGGRDVSSGAARESICEEEYQSREVAIKEIARTNITETFPAEASILKHLQHPNIVQLYRVDESYSDYIYLVLEYCKGGDLKSFMQNHMPLPEDLVRQLFEHLTSGLEFLYERNFIHRDIKPQNLLLSEHSLFDYSLTDQLQPNENIKLNSIILKIADFGSARYLQKSSLAFTVCGSPLYMAPEVLQRQSYDHKSDLWSAGVVLYEMICGEPAFIAQTEADLLRQMKCFDGPKFPGTLPVTEECHRLLGRLLVIDQNRRIGHNEFFQESRKFTGDTRSIDINVSFSRAELTTPRSLSTKSSAALIGSSIVLNLDDDFLSELDASELLTDQLHILHCENNCHAHVTPQQSLKKVSYTETDEGISKASLLLPDTAFQSIMSVEGSEMQNLTNQVGPFAEISHDFNSHDNERMKAAQIGSFFSFSSWGRVRLLLACSVIIIYIYLTGNTSSSNPVKHIAADYFDLFNRTYHFLALYAVREYPLGASCASNKLLAAEPMYYTVTEEASAVWGLSTQNYPPLILVGADSSPLDGDASQKCYTKEIALEIAQDLVPNIALEHCCYFQEDLDSLSSSYLSSDTYNIAMPTEWQKTSSEFSRILRVLEFMFFWISVIIFWFYIRETVKLMTCPQVTTAATMAIPCPKINDYREEQCIQHVKWRAEKTIKLERI